jgi:predicted GNAT family N-acyltransferase
VSRPLVLSEALRAGAPELADLLSSVRVADLAREREAVFAFRYSVYVEELGRGVGTVDERRRWIRDSQDDEPATKLLFTTDEDGELTGTARIWPWRPGAIPDDARRTYSLDGFTGMEQLGAAEVGRVMLLPRHRGGMGFQALIGAAYELAVSERGADMLFLTCLSGLIDSYRRTGFRTYAAPLVATVDGLTVPLLLAVSDCAHLARVASFLLPLAKARYGPGKLAPIDLSRWGALFETASGPLQLDPTVIWDRVRLRSQVGDPGALFLAAIGEATMRKLIDHGVLMNVEAGQVLTKQGLVQQELFVIIAGRYEVHDGMRRLRVVGPGEVVGEIGFFSTTRRRSATIRAAIGGQVLVVRRRWLDDVRHSDPAAAADVLFQLARTLADRVNSHEH